MAAASALPVSSLALTATATSRSLRSTVATPGKPRSPSPAPRPGVDRSSAVVRATAHVPEPDTTIQVQAGSKWKPAICVVIVEVFNTGTILLGKLALDGGMFVFSLLSYRSVLGAVFMLPFALFLERGRWKELNMKALGWLFINAFLGYSLPMALYYYGLHDTTASYGVIFSSLTPLFTFVLSLLLGMESLRLKSKEGSAKVVGALVCFAGALLISLYKGEELHLLSPVLKGITKSSHGVAGGHHHSRGTLLLLGDSICYAFWYPIQVKVLKVYPWKYWSTVLTCVLGGLQTCAVGIIMRRDKLAWQVGWNIQLLTIVYSAALGTAAKYWLNLYAVEKRGPVFPPMFSTLSIIFTMVLGALLLGETLTVGSLLGSAFVFIGLYTYLYGKAREVHAKTAPGSSHESLQVQPVPDSKCDDPESGP
ncbi:WAT1-related protein At5g64700-like [Triticum dicoccoides]|uniref:WAT1-related protein At5g64700-like n=1 Tax=Triticum dicoccoides TaxID=85692 RepID=UPI000E7B4E87|nr:WAT1-related protein At5g64700-like [Triticum dicoccoides]